MASSVQIVSTGARTPLGLQGPAIAAAVRAGMSRLGEHPFMVNHLGDPMAAAMDDRLDPGLMGPDRFLALAETALSEACAPFTSSNLSKLRFPLYLGLPEIRPGFTEHDVAAIRSGLAHLGRLPIEISEVTILNQGHAAGLAALAMATEQIQNGACDACVIGGVESYFHPDTMEWLDENGQLAGADARSAFVPGEGAGFCVLMNDRARDEVGLGALGRVVAVGIGKETKLIKTSDVCLGAGLTVVVRGVVAGPGPPSKTINAIICDINSERYRCEEWGFVCMRLSQYFDDPTDYLSPADCWGDVGAASGPLFAMLSCQAAGRGYAKGPRTLIWASSERGLRAAAVMEFQTMTKIGD